MRAAAFAATMLFALAACSGGGQYVSPQTPSPTPTPRSGASTSPVASASPASGATSSASASPAPASSSEPPPSPAATATPNAVTQNVDASGHAAGDANALMAPSVAGYGGALGYPPNNSNVVSVTTTAYQGLAPGAPAPSNGATVLYSTTTSFTGGPPANQTSLVFTGNGSTVGGVLDIPFPSNGTFSVSLYAPAYGNGALYTASGLTETNGKITFGSPFAAGSMETVPLPLTVDIELTQP